MKYNYTSYIGTPWVSGGRDPYNALDCWGLVWSVYNDVYGIYLPSLDQLDVDANGTEETAASVQAIYPDVHKDFIEVDAPREGDIILINMAGEPIHVGLALTDKTMMHTSRRSGCVVENFNRRIWKHRIQSFHRHKAFK